MYSAWFNKKKFFKLILCFCLTIIIANSFVSVSYGWGGDDSAPEPVEFSVEFDKNDPYEMVLTAEKYRQEVLNENITEESWRRIYFDRAINLYKKVFLRDSYFAYGYLSYAYTQILAAEVLGDKERYYNDVRRLIHKMAPEDYETSLLTGQLYCFEEKWDKARISFDKAIELGGKTSTLNAWLGYVLAAGDEDVNAQQSYRAAINANTDPDSVRWANDQLDRTGKPWQMPPIVPPQPPRRAIQPASIKIRFQVMQFEDVTNTIGHGATIFSHLLTTSLFNSGRFNLVNVIKGTEASEEYVQNVDVVLTGTIIRVSPDTGEFILSIKAVYPMTGNLLLAENVPISYLKTADAVQVADKEVRKVADMIERKLARGEGKVLHIEGRKLIVSLGSENGVQSGFTALIVGKNERVVKNPLTGEVIERDVYLGEVVFERVEEKYSTARLLTPGRVFMRVKDIVRLK